MLCLGLVILPEAGRQAQLLAELKRFPAISVGQPQGHRVPAVAEIACGRDEELIAGLEQSPSVLRVDVVFAQIIEETSA